MLLHKRMGNCTMAMILSVVSDSLSTQTTWKLKDLLFMWIEFIDVYHPRN